MNTFVEAAREKIIGSAGSKIILLGEHAVVHGTPALAVGIPNKIQVTAKSHPGSTELQVNTWNFYAITSGDTPEDTALHQLCTTLGVQTEGVTLFAETKIPAGSGLGASAAIAAATSKALLSYYRLDEDPGKVFEAVQASEKIFHGNPSGLDAAAVMVAGVIRYTKETGPGEIKCKPPNLLIVHSGDVGLTKVTVARFSKKLLAFQEEGKKRLHRIEELVNQGEGCLFSGDMKKLGLLMTENQAHLNWFGVSTDHLNKICEISLSAGALGAKLTGGGGGGCAVILVTQDNREQIIGKLQEADYRVLL